MDKEQIETQRVSVIQEKQEAPTMSVMDELMQNAVPGIVHNPPPPNAEERARMFSKTWEDMAEAEQEQFEEAMAEAEAADDKPDKGMSVLEIADLVTSMSCQMDRYGFLFTDRNNCKWIAFYSTEESADPAYAGYSGVCGCVVLCEGPKENRILFGSPRYMYPSQFAHFAVRLCLFGAICDAMISHYVAMPEMLEANRLRKLGDVN